MNEPRMHREAREAAGRMLDVIAYWYSSLKESVAYANNPENRASDRLNKYDARINFLRHRNCLAGPPFDDADLARLALLGSVEAAESENLKQWKEIGVNRGVLIPCPQALVILKRLDSGIYEFDAAGASGDRVTEGPRGKLPRKIDDVKVDKKYPSDRFSRGIIGVLLSKPNEILAKKDIADAIRCSVNTIPRKRDDLLRDDWIEEVPVRKPHGKDDGKGWTLGRRGCV